MNYSFNLKLIAQHRQLCENGAKQSYDKKNQYDKPKIWLKHVDSYHV